MNYQIMVPLSLEQRRTFHVLYILIFRINLLAQPCLGFASQFQTEFVYSAF